MAGKKPDVISALSLSEKGLLVSAVEGLVLIVHDKEIFLPGRKACFWFFLVFSILAILIFTFKQKPEWSDGQAVRKAAVVLAAPYAERASSRFVWVKLRLDDEKAEKIVLWMPLRYLNDIEFSVGNRILLDIPLENKGLEVLRVFRSTGEEIASERVMMEAVVYDYEYFFRLGLYLSFFASLSLFRYLYLRFKG